MARAVPFRSTDALLLVDVQRDFFSGGAMAVPGADEILPVLNRYLFHFANEQLPVFVTRDWHPSDHCSFRAQGGMWPEHCVADTEGAGFPAGLMLPGHVVVVSKGRDRAHEAYSGFAGTDLERRLRAAGIRRLYIGGLATDYCVRGTVRDALRLGFSVYLLGDAIRAVNRAVGDGTLAEEEMRALGAVMLTVDALARWTPGTDALLMDLYQLKMIRGYLAANMEETAVFEFFVRRLPGDWNFLVAGGLEQALAYLEDFRFSPADLEWLKDVAGFSSRLVLQLSDLRFTGDVHAMPEGTIFFPDEPILRITAPLLQAQMVETRLINLLHFQTLIASKAVRCVIAAPGKRLVDYGLRRAHGDEAGLMAARASYIAGFAGTSNVCAWNRLGIPCAGTMAHSFVEACPSEQEAFLRFARANPEHVVFVLDTYDTEAAAVTVVRIAPVLRAEGIMIEGVRLDSGDLGDHARRVRRILDDAGLTGVTIFASGNLDEYALQKLVAAGAPIDGYGLGSKLTTSSDAPFLDCAYKLQVYAGEPRCKHSEGKATWPGAKQVYRSYDRAGLLEHDTIALDEEVVAGEPLLTCVMRQGERTENPAPLPALRHHVGQQLQRLPLPLLALERLTVFPVQKSAGLVALAERLGVFRLAPATTGPRDEPGAPLHLRRLHRIYADGETVEDASGVPQGAGRRE